MAIHPGLRLPSAILTVGHRDTEKTLDIEPASLQGLKMCIDIYFIIFYKTSFGYTGHCTE